MTGMVSGRTAGGLVRAVGVLALLWLAVAAGVATAAPRKVIIDDDVIGFNGAPVLLLQAPDVEVLGITTGSGSVWRDTATAHALRTLEILGRSDVPVHPGSVFPLINSQEQVKRWEGMYGRLVYKGPWTDYWPEGTVQTAPPNHAPDHVPTLPEGNPTTKAQAEHAALFLIRKAREFPGEITLVATGPMTNIALAQSLDPGFAANVKEIVYMGGSLNPQQRLGSVSAEQFAREYVNSPRREFNIRWDPEAARIMAHAPWRKITMIPVDPSTGTEWTREFLDGTVKAAKTPLTAGLAKHLEPGFPMWDELAAMVWLHPEIVTRQDMLYVDFETGMTSAYGDTLSWSAEYRPKLGEQAQTVVREIDRAKLEAAMRALYVRPLRR